MYYIVIPTYNEKENIVRTIKKVRSECAKIDQEFSILVADDNSPDGTKQVLTT